MKRRKQPITLEEGFKMPSFFDEDVRIRDREIRELNRERREIERERLEGDPE